MMHRPENDQNDQREVDVDVTYLQMLDGGQLVPSSETELVVTEAEIPSPDLNRFLYEAVGRSWSWTHRLAWSDVTWQKYLSRPELSTWLACIRGTPAGYFELEQQGTEIEIRSFGVLPQFVGRGFGGDLLTRAVRIAWAMRATRVWLHTCSLDSPMGLKNYLARGFRIYKTERIKEVQSHESP